MFWPQINNCALYCHNLFGTLFALILCSGTDYALFGANLASKLCRNSTSQCNGAIWYEFSEQHKHKRIKQAPYLMPDENFFNANRVQLFKAHFNLISYNLMRQISMTILHLRWKLYNILTSWNWFIFFNTLFKDF